MNIKFTYVSAGCITQPDGQRIGHPRLRLRC